jgi:hypothetical protein
VDALFWNEIREDAPVIFEETEDNGKREYVLTVLHGSRRDTNFEIDRKIRFDRTDLTVAEIDNFGAEGKLESVVHYEDWQPAGEAQFARDIRVQRPHDDYELDIQVTKLAVNETIASERFHLAQPPGAQLVEVGKETEEAKP